MQKVFSSNQQVAHIWAQQSQSDMSFTGTKTIYSHGAIFPVKDAKKAFEHVLFCRENKEVWQANGQNIKLGNFHIDQIDTHGNVRASCHYVEFAEIERNAKLLGWV